MKSNILGIVFTILSGVLIVMIILAYERSDREKPEFRFSALNLTYDSDTTDNDLIDGINAYDAVDGDLTSRIVVEKVVLNKDAKTAVVYYAVADYSGNVAKQSRVFPADIKSMVVEADELQSTEDMNFPQLSFGEGESSYASSEVSAEANP